VTVDLYGCIELTRIADIAEAEDAERQDEESVVTESEPSGPTMDQALRSLNDTEEEIKTLKIALSECWNLCNTLAGLSSVHRERMFSFSGSGGMQEQAWRSCWKLCQKLYETRDEDHASQVRPTLEMCREFCQALFEARSRGDEVADSILRVSFELNNHLYNTHDRNLPEAFRERTLDFYITMCHRLMKQRTSLPEETDSLLRACWTLAEMLFSLRQQNRDHKPADEELLGSAVQACWELCDLFREGWTQVRPERGTPRPVQSIFPSNMPPTYTTVAQMVVQSESRPSSSLSLNDTYHSAKSFPPETPTTVFDDTAEMSPDEAPQPNILVLGPETNSRNNARWSSASSVSSYSTASRSSTTAGRANSEPEDPHLLRLKALILKAAMNAGFSRTSTQPLPDFVALLHPNAFGPQLWQLNLLSSYRRLVASDPALREQAALPSGRKTSAEVATAVQWMGRSEQFGWLRDLYRVVFGFAPEEAGGRKNVWIQT